MSPFPLQFDAMSFQVALSHHTILCHVMVCNASPMHSYDISKHACQCDTAWCVMQRRSLDRHVLQPSTNITAKHLQKSSATNIAPWRKNLASSHTLRHGKQRTTLRLPTVRFTNPRNWFRLLPSFLPTSSPFVQRCSSQFLIHTPPSMNMVHVSSVRPSA